MAAKKYAVTGEQYRTTDRRMREIKRQLDQEGGSPLDPDAVASALQNIINGGSTAVAFHRDMLKESCELMEDVGETQLLSPNQLELAFFLILGENHIKGEELVERAKKVQANLGQRQAEYLLEHQDEIPEEWRQCYLVFPGTIWRDRDGHRTVPYLYWCGERWYLHFDWLDYGFDSGDRLLRPRESR